VGDKPSPLRYPREAREPVVAAEGDELKVRKIVEPLQLLGHVRSLVLPLIAAQ